MKKTSVILVVFLFISINILAQKKTNMQGIEIGSMAPEIELPTVDGEIFSLSELKGKIVFVSFWASWCKPCRKKTPELIEVFEKFNQTEFDSGEIGFEIVYVSMDRDENTWKNSIEKDSIGDFINVGDMKGWKCAAARTYYIKSIPSSVLIDGNGKIIELNLDPQQLNKKLRQLKRGGWFWF